MRGSFRNSIRAKLIFLVAVTSIPALVIMLYSGLTLRKTIENNARAAILRQVRGVAALHERVITDARMLLQTLAKAQGIASGDIKAARIVLEEMRTQNTAFVALALADAQGRVLCAIPEGNATYTGCRAFDQAVVKKCFTLGEYTLFAQNRVVIDFFYPVLGHDGGVQNVLIASFDLGFFRSVFADTHRAAGAVLTLTNAHGTRLTRFPLAEKYTWVSDLSRMLTRMSGARSQGTFLETGVDGVFRLYAYTRIILDSEPPQTLYIRLGEPGNLALAGMRSAMWRNVSFLFLAAGLAFGMARIVGGRAIMRPIEHLLGVVEKLKAGDLGARTSMGQGGELCLLGQAFNDMAATLERTARQRSLAEEEIRGLNAVLEKRVAARTQELGRSNEELQKALNTLHQAQDQLVFSEKLAALGGLVAGVAHEINTPVGVALSAVSTLQEKHTRMQTSFANGELKRSDLVQYLDVAEEGLTMTFLNLERASALVRSFKQISVDQVSEQRRNFDLAGYIGEVLMSLRPRLKNTAHKVEVDCPVDLKLTSYPGAFSQILSNLIVNSLLHAFGPGEAGILRIIVRQEGEDLLVRYSDTGRGIPEDKLKHIFEPFYTTARNRGSTGLGLHIVYNIVTGTLGGSIFCQSEPDAGTTFEMHIPCGELS